MKYNNLTSAQVQNGPYFDTHKSTTGTSTYLADLFSNKEIVVIDRSWASAINNTQAIDNIDANITQQLDQLKNALCAAEDVLICEGKQISIPILRRTVINDTTYWLEWIMPNFRIGFNIEHDESESGWYLISKPIMGSIDASGSLVANEINKTTKWLLTFMFDHIEEK